MKKISTLILLLLMIKMMFAQNVATPLWTANTGFQDSLTITPMCTDNYGNVYVASFTLDNTTGANIIIQKYNRDGDTVYTTHYTSTGNYRDQATCLSLDANYNLYVGGFTYSSSINKYDYIILKLDSAGSQQWTYTHNGSASLNDVVTAIVHDNGNIYVTGTTWETASTMDYTTLKLNASGVLQWIKTYNYINLADVPFSIAVSDTNVIITGGSQSSLTNWDYATVQYSTSGNAIDTLRISGTGIGFDHATQVVTDDIGYIYVTGVVANSSTGLDYKTMKLTKLGVVKWIQTYDRASLDDLAQSVTIDADGNVYVTGQSKNITGNNDYATVKYDSLGNFVWVRFYDNGFNDKANKVINDNEGNIFVTGESENGSNSDFATLAYSSSGDTLWTKRSNSIYNAHDRATAISTRDGYVYVSGQTQINSAQYKNVTIAYGQAKIKEIPDLLGEEKSSNLFYLPNDGQLANDTGSVATNILFYVPNHYPSLFFTNYGLSYVFSKIKNDTLANDTIHRIDMQFLNGNNLVMSKVYPNNSLSNHYNNFYYAHCPYGVIDVQGSTMLMTQSLYEGIDLYYSSNQTGEKHYWVLAPNANPKAIKIKFDGATSVNTPIGKYSIQSSIGLIEYDSLVAYEINALGNIITGTSQPLQFLHDTINNTYSFKTFSYNASNTLVIMAKQKVSATPPQNNYNINWCTYWGEGADDRFTNLTHDDENNVIFCGNTTSLIFPPAAGMNLPDSTSTQGLSDGIIIKINDIMEPQWLTFIGGSNDEKVTSIAAKNNGNLVCVGSTSSDNLPIFTPTGAYADTVTDTSVDSWLLTEFNKNGYLLWSSAFEAGKQAKDVAITEIGKGEVVFIVGEAYHGADTIGVAGATTYPSWNGGNYKHSYMMRFEGIGERTWATYLGGKYGSANAIAINDFNQMFVAGYFADTDPNSAQTPGEPWGPNSNVYVWAYNTQSLQLKWADSWGSWENEMLNDIAVDHLGNVFAVGSAEGYTPIVDYDINDSTDFMDEFLSIARDGMIVRHDSLGVRKWFTYFGTNEFEEIKTAIVDGNNNLYIAGTIDHDSIHSPLQQPPNFYVQANINDLTLGFKDSFIARFNNNCGLEWSTFYGTKYEAVNDQINSLMLCNQRLYFCGFVDGGGFDSLLIPVRELDPSQGSIDYFQKFSNSPFTGTEAFAGCFDTLVISGINKKQKSIDLKLLLFPNPTNEQINIRLASNVKELATLSVFDSKGELVLNAQLQLQNGVNNFKINTSKLNAGLYFVSINSNQTHENTKFIKQ